MKSVSVRTKLTLWNVGVMALTLGVLGVAVFYGARQSLLSSVNSDLQRRGDNLAKRAAQTIGEPERHMVVSGVLKGTPTVTLPMGRRGEVTLSFLQTGPGRFEALDPAPPPPDATRSNIRTRFFDLEGKNTALVEKDPPYDMAAFRTAAAGKEAFTDLSVENNLAPPGSDKYEPIRVLSIPVIQHGKI